MTTITFDTHKFVRRLVAEGATEGQAQAHVDALQEVLASHASASSKELATKADVAALREATKEDIAVLKSEMHQRFAEMEVKLTLRLGGIVMAGVALLGVMVKLL